MFLALSYRDDALTNLASRLTNRLFPTDILSASDIHIFLHLLKRSPSSGDAMADSILAHAAAVRRDVARKLGREDLVDIYSSFLIPASLRSRSSQVAPSI